MTTAISSAARFYALRLEPGTDVLKSVQQFVADNDLKAVAIVTVVGSLTDAVIRYANQPHGTTSRGHFEIVSMVGTVEPTGAHVHLSLSDGTGAMFGGHMLPGCLVYTTAEIVLAHLEDFEFARVACPKSGYDELMIRMNG
ncbi:PPC domain-containing DNA-binding protein [Mesorhizobium sp. BAC0120]|uniref:PPC domain-containing DNA-binding protein n=1 Tax=Mesorhizobium sp. BAC0120 TaxID=3090670 RepID=UPI00298C7290|nr:PPC domain-containing DNA-binding protein [Mesorhizobium sp. BAC0120]MDW6023215.1 PPC domain-containing DNA-binding protein [Mesorhizobium sp. BAC0120]